MGEAKGVARSLLARPVQFETHQFTDTPADFVHDGFRAPDPQRGNLIDDTGGQVDALPARLRVLTIGERRVGRVRLRPLQGIEVDARYGNSRREIDRYDEDLALAGALELYGLDREGLAGSFGDGGSGLHGPDG